MAIAYRVDLADPASHRYRVTLTVPSPAACQRLSLPVWIPGSYMVREFARHLSGLSARQGRQAVPLRQLDKTTWEADCTGRSALVLSYEVYAFDASVRTAWLDDSRGFFNTTCLCLRVHGREAEPHELSLGTLPKGWDVATAMPAVPGRPRTWVSADHDELSDHPFELGAFWRGRFEVAGVEHEFVVAGAWPGFDGERLLADTRRICATQLAFWHGRRKPVFNRYVFMLWVVEDGYGGLEHRASTALIAKRRDLPRIGQPAQSEGYVTLLGLISHEYFHTWNVKRLKPREFLRYDYDRENYTELLWFFEGFTSYYDDLLLQRAGLIDAGRYLKLLSRTINGVRATPGRRVQSVAQASFDAWNKYYRTDENTPNATVSYYTKGALVALLLDLRLRAGSGSGSLDDVMRALFKAHASTGLTEADVLAAVEDAGGPELARELAGWVHGLGDLPLETALQAAGVQIGHDSTGFAASLGLKLTEGPVTGSVVKSVLEGSAASRAGLSAQDELLAVDGWRIRRLEDAAQWLTEGQAFELTYVRQQRLRTARVVPGGEAGVVQSWTLSLTPQPGARVADLRKGWLGE